MKLSIIVPAFNEEKTIEKNLNALLKVDLGNIDREIIVVNDCSTDKTAQKLKKYQANRKIKIFSHSNNQGKGAAIKTGLSRATGSFLIIQDADFEYDPKDIKNLLRAINNRKQVVVYGSRYIGKNKDTFFHKFGNKFLTVATNFLYGSSLTDMETCYKLMPKAFLRSITVESKRFNFEPEITAKILKSGYKIIEIPISYHKRGFYEGKKLRWWKDGFSAIWTLSKYRVLK